MAEAVFGLSGIAGTVSGTIQDISDQLVVWLRKMFMTVWRFAIAMFNRILNYLMKDPVGFVTAMGEFAVLLG